MQSAIEFHARGRALSRELIDFRVYPVAQLDKSSTKGEELIFQPGAAIPDLLQSTMQSAKERCDSAAPRIQPFTKVLNWCVLGDFIKLSHRWSGNRVGNVLNKAALEEG